MLYFCQVSCITATPSFSIWTCRKTPEAVLLTLEECVFNDIQKPKARTHILSDEIYLKNFLTTSSMTFHPLAMAGWQCPLSLLLLCLPEGRRKQFEVPKSLCTHHEDSSVVGQVALTLCPGFPTLSNGHD